MSNIPMPVYRDSNFKTAERTADLLSRMTLKEKIAQLHCHGRVVEMEGILFDEDGNIIKEKMNELFSNGMCQLGAHLSRIHLKKQHRSPMRSRSTW